MKNGNKILDFTITLYSNRKKIVKEVVCKPTELEAVIDQLDEQASVPRRGDGHHGYYIEVEVRRHKDVNPVNGCKRLAKSAAGEKHKVHSGGRRSTDDKKSGRADRRNGSGVRPRKDDLCGSTSRDKGKDLPKPGGKTGSAADQEKEQSKCQSK